MGTGLTQRPGGGIRLVVVDPGHFHAALVQKEMYPEVAPQVRVHAPLGPELDDYVGHIARFNSRADNPTCWELDICPRGDVRACLAQEAPGGVAILSGRNRGKLALIEAAVTAGLHVLADKPLIIRREDLRSLGAALDRAAEKGLVVCDLMTGRHDAVSVVLRALRADPELFGEPVAGTPDEPAVDIVSTHHLMKYAAGVPNRRPPWYFDIDEQGEGLADIGTHVVDRAHRTLFGEAALDWEHDIVVHRARRWPTRLSLAQFQEVTGVESWPDYLKPRLAGDEFDYFCNMRAQYRVRGVEVAIEARWEWQSPSGDDSHSAQYRGNRARLLIRQGAAEQYRPELFVVPEADIGAALAQRIATLQTEYPGLALETRDGEWRVAIPQALRRGHDAHFTMFTREFIKQVAHPETQVPSHRTNLIAKYLVTTEGVALSRR